MSYTSCTETNVSICDETLRTDTITTVQLPSSSTHTSPLQNVVSGVIPLQFAQITRDSDVSTFTGLAGADMFRSIFNFMKHKAAVMQYWDGNKRTNRTRKRPSSVQSTEQLLISPEYDISEDMFPIMKSGPARKLSLEQELLLVLMRLRLGLLIEDFAFRFGVSAGKVSQTVITWVILLEKKLFPLIIWPSRNQVRATLPNCYKRLYPKQGFCQIREIREIREKSGNLI